MAIIIFPVTFYICMLFTAYCNRNV